MTNIPHIGISLIKRFQVFDQKLDNEYNVTSPDKVNLNDVSMTIKNAQY